MTKYAVSISSQYTGVLSRHLMHLRIMRPPSHQNRHNGVAGLIRAEHGSAGWIALFQGGFGVEF
jgi:hypothetical protein